LRAWAQPTEIEFVFEPQEDGGYYVYSPDLPGLHTKGETLDEATANAVEALALYVEGCARKAGRSEPGTFGASSRSPPDGAPAGRLRRAARKSGCRAS
jgi:predicted RNase H-like HicB family nuclease